MKRFFIVILFSVLFYFIGHSQVTTLPDSLHENRLPPTQTIEKKPWRAASIGFGVNMGIWGFNRFIMNEHFAYINWKTIKRNLKTYPVWDTDKFSTNLIGHPYHGSLYFNAARVNGYSFYESIPFTLGGSLMWEFAMENEPPSRNDLVATTIGGMALGEITLRMTDQILDNRSTGMERFIREFAAGALAPSRLINRIITGEAWRHQSRRGNLLPIIPIHGSFTLGGRYITDYDDSKKPGISGKIGVEYGDIFDYEIEKPFEWFQAKAQFDIISGKFSLTQINLAGALKSKELYYKNNWQIFGGFFQHFNYFNSKVIMNDNSEFRPYYISEAASLGSGILIEKEGGNIALLGKYFLNGILLGASISDHFKIDDRDYNMGSGFSLKAHTEVAFREELRFRIRMESYHLFTWKGYDETIDFKDWSSYDKNMLSIQGDKSKARLYLLGATLEYDLSKNWYIGLERNRYIRKTSYRYLPNVRYEAWDDHISLGYKF